MSWVKWKDKQGVRLMGSNRYNPSQPWDKWTKIMGVVARCEGNHDTVISYDGTGVTWGFMQWTFTSGRLQRLLEYFKSIEYFDFTKDNDSTLFRECFECRGVQIFEKYGFKIEKGSFIDLVTAKPVSPSSRAGKNRIDDICMGRIRHSKLSDQKTHATRLAELFSAIGKLPEVEAAQIEYAQGEFKRCLKVKRPPLKHYKTIHALLDGSWDSYAPAVFFNLWQNSPAAAYKLFIRAKDACDSPQELAEVSWRYLKNSKFANWSYAKSGNKSPRILRISKAIEEFYGIKLPVR